MDHETPTIAVLLEDIPTDPEDEIELRALPSQELVVYIREM